ncbi:MAG: ATPase [Anaerolineae bacterium]|nr:ATPase [Anaerolineae bacterium]
MTESRVSTGITELDKMLRGGFLPHSVIQIRGAPGTGKTSLALQFLLEGIKEGQNGIFITFEEFPQSLYRDAESLGFDLRTPEREGKLRIIFTSPQVLQTSIQDPLSSIHSHIREANVQRAVLDSATHFNRLTNNPVELRHIYTGVVNSLRREQITTLLLSEEKRSQYRRTDKGGLAFLVDGIILLRYVEVESAIKRAIVVLKMRGSDHDQAIRDYHIQNGGLVVDGIFEQRGSLLSGISHRA